MEESRAQRIVKEAVRDVFKEQQKGGSMSSDAMQQTGEIDAEIGGQKFKYNGPLNTLATVLTLLVVCLIAYGGFTHMQDTRTTSVDLVAALKEQTQALRENTCAATYQGPPEQKATFCKQVTR